MQQCKKKKLGSGHNHPSHNATLIKSNDEINEFIKIIKPLEESGLLLKGVTETVQNEIKEQKGGFFSMLLGTLGESLLENILTGKGIYRAGKGKGVLMPNWSEEVFVVSKIKHTVPWRYIINDLNGKEIIGAFSEKDLQKTNQKSWL